MDPKPAKKVNAEVDYAKRAAAAFPPRFTQVLERLSFRPKTVMGLFIAGCTVSYAGATELTKFIVKILKKENGIVESDGWNWVPYDLFDPAGHSRIVFESSTTAQATDE